MSWFKKLLGGRKMSEEVRKRISEPQNARPLPQKGNTALDECKRIIADLERKGTDLTTYKTLLSAAERRGVCDRCGIGAAQKQHIHKNVATLWIPNLRGSGATTADHLRKRRTETVKISGC